MRIFTWKRAALGVALVPALAVGWFLSPLSEPANDMPPMASRPKKAGQPNILFIMADDHAYQAISAYGSGLNRTPNIDRLAADGVVFDRALVPNSICAPARAAILTGAMSHVNGQYSNLDRFNGEQPTMPKMLQAVGYETALIGKWHLATNPTGFDHWEILTDTVGQGRYFHANVRSEKGKAQWPGYVTTDTTDRALSWLKGERQASDRPFLLMVHYKAPHRTWDPDIADLPAHNGGPIAEPETMRQSLTERAPVVGKAQMDIGRDMSGRDLHFQYPDELTPAERAAYDQAYGPDNAAYGATKPDPDQRLSWRYQRFMRDYLRTVDSVDRNVGRLLDYLQQAGLADNTLVIYTSDQGAYLGEYGWFDKRWIMEPSVRTPLLLRWPGVAAPQQRVAAIASQLDIPATILDAAGVVPDARMQGRSLRPLLQSGGTPDWRKSAYYHYYECPGEHNVPCHLGVITDRYKLVHYYAPDIDQWELLDRQRDPGETRNFFNDPDYAPVVAEMRIELERLREEYGDRAPLKQRTREAILSWLTRQVRGVMNARNPAPDVD